jgi:hypothetical protein
MPVNPYGSDSGQLLVQIAASVLVPRKQEEPRVACLETPVQLTEQGFARHHKALNGHRRPASEKAAPPLAVPAANKTVEPGSCRQHKAIEPFSGRRCHSFRTVATPGSDASRFGDSRRLDGRRVTYDHVARHHPRTQHSQSSAQQILLPPNGSFASSFPYIHDLFLARCSDCDQWSHALTDSTVVPNSNFQTLNYFRPLQHQRPPDARSLFQVRNQRFHQLIRHEHLRL